MPFICTWPSIIVRKKFGWSVSGVSFNHRVQRFGYTSINWVSLFVLFSILTLTLSDRLIPVTKQFGSQESIPVYNFSPTCIRVDTKQDWFDLLDSPKHCDKHRPQNSSINQESSSPLNNLHYLSESTIELFRFINSILKFLSNHLLTTVNWNGWVWIQYSNTGQQKRYWNESVAKERHCVWIWTIVFNPLQLTWR